MRRYLFNALLAGALVLSACGDDDDDNGRTGADGNGTERPPEVVVPDESCAGLTPARTVTMRGNAFVPDDIEIGFGEVVRWVNEDGETHTVTSGERDDADAGRLFDATVPPGGEFCYRFEVRSDRDDDDDDIDYFCRIHTGMDGEVEIEDDFDDRDDDDRDDDDFDDDDDDNDDDFDDDFDDDNG